jgi:hypothetical protein
MLQIQPEDADVTIDGQPWTLSQGSLAVDLTEGRHVIQVRKPGFVGYMSEVDVRSGDTATLNISLRAQP